MIGPYAYLDPKSTKMTAQALLKRAQKTMISDTFGVQVEQPPTVGKKSGRIVETSEVKVFTLSGFRNPFSCTPRCRYRCSTYTGLEVMI